MAGLKELENGIKKYHESLLKRQSAISGFIKTRLLPIYQIAQDARWKSEGASEGFNFKSVSNEWARKKQSYQSKDPSEYPGGERLMVFRGYLAKAAMVTGEAYTYQSGGNTYYVVGKNNISGSRLEISIESPYAAIQDERSHFMKFGKPTKDKMIQEIKKFMALVERK